MDKRVEPGEVGTFFLLSLGLTIVGLGALAVDAVRGAPLYSQWDSFLIFLAAIFCYIKYREKSAIEEEQWKEKERFFNERRRRQEEREAREKELDKAEELIKQVDGEERS